VQAAKGMHKEIAPKAHFLYGLIMGIRDVTASQDQRSSRARSFHSSEHNLKRLPGLSKSSLAKGNSTKRLDWLDWLKTKGLIRINKLGNVVPTGCKYIVNQPENLILRYFDDLRDCLFRAHKASSYISFLLKQSFILTLSRKFK